MKKALITGAAGQDGSYLAEYLLEQGYKVYGLVRRAPELTPWLKPLVGRVEFLFGDLCQADSLEVAIWKSWPDEIYNLGGQVFVPVSWSRPAETFDVNVGGLVRLLEIVERAKRDIRVYQASSSEMYGNTDEPFISESTPFAPVSPYGASKLAAHEMVRVYRERGLFVVGGILFNHEGPRRGPEMVTRKIARAVAGWAVGRRDPLELGNLDARRDWGFAGDYVRAMHAMLQQESPQDYVVGTGESHSVRDFLYTAAREAGLDSAVWINLVQADSRLTRTKEIRNLRASATRAKMELGWEPTVDFTGLVRMMVRSELLQLQGSPAVAVR